jgi:hypothetical protein
MTVAQDRREFESHRAHLRTMAYRILDELGFPGTRGFAGAFIYKGSHSFERGASSLLRLPRRGPDALAVFPSAGRRALRGSLDHS